MSKTIMENESQEHATGSSTSPRPAPESRVSFFLVNPTLNRITEYEVEKVTESFVTIAGKRHARATTYEYFEPTLELAQERLLEIHELRVGKAASMFEVRKMDLERARAPQIKRLPERDAETTTVG